MTQANKEAPASKEVEQKAKKEKDLEYEPYKPRLTEDGKTECNQNNTKLWNES